MKKEDTIQQAQKIKLNHNCIFCNKEIYIGNGTIIEGKPYHFECYKKELISKIIGEQKKKFVEIIEEIIIWARQWAEYVDDEEVLKKWREEIGVSKELKQKLGR